MKKAIFLDRDGTINKDVRFLSDFKNFELIEGTMESLNIFQDLGFHLFITSNQSGVARGYFSIQQVERLNCQIKDYLKQRHVTITEIVYCPHLEQGIVPEYAVTCNCRKPKPGMIYYLQKKYNIDLKQSYTVGDKLRDVQAGLTAGTRAALVKNGPENPDAGEVEVPQFDTLLDFARSLRAEKGRS